MLGGADQRGGDHAVTHRRLRPINIVEKRFEGEHALRDTGLNAHPFLLLDDARNRVERERALFAGEVERHALRQVGAREGIRSAPEIFLGHARQRAEDILVSRAGFQRRERCRVGEHFVPRCGRAAPGTFSCCGAVAGEQVNHVVSVLPGSGPIASQARGALPPS